MPRAWRLVWAGLMALGLAGGPAQAIHLRGEILRVGYTGSGRNENQQGSDHYRIGYFTPVYVELTNDDGDTFNGVIEVRQSDRDGDEIVARREIMLVGTKRFYLYVPGSEDQSKSPFRVRVLELDGSLAKLYDNQNKLIPEMMPAIPPVNIETEARVILDIGEVNRLKELTQAAQMNRPATVLRVAPDQLPDNVAGLEMIDTVVWDGGDPTEFKATERYEALREWTRRGGQLVIGVSKNWQLLNSKFEDMLPVRLTRADTMAKPDPKWQEELMGAVANPFEPPLPYCPVLKADLRSGAMPILPAEVDPEDPILAARWAYGRGEVVLVMTELRDVTSPTRRSNVEAVPFLRKLVGLRYEEAKQDDPQRMGMAEDLFRYVEQQTGFQVMTQLYLLFAFLFVVGYVVLATGGSWLWLKKRKLVQHAWPAFAAVAVVSALVSLAAVQLIRGVGYKVQEMAFVDATADSSEAAAIVYYGLKTPTHTTLDLRLASQGRTVEETPAGTTLLRPLGVSVGPMKMNGTKFKAPQRYETRPDLGEIRSVPLRATLKQFEASWRGQMPGKLNASLRRQRGELRPDSWIRNDLGTDLKMCYLVVPTLAARWPDRKGIYNLHCYSLGDLAKGQRITMAEVEAMALKAQGKKPGDRLQIMSLMEVQRSWLKGFGARVDQQQWGGTVVPVDEQDIDLGRINNALMLVSMFDEIGRDMRLQVDRTQGQHLDRSLSMTREMALMIGFSGDAGPAALCWRQPGNEHGKWHAMASEADGRKVMYRVSIPVEP